LTDIPNKTFEVLVEELYPKANRLRNEKDEEYNKVTGAIKQFPSL
jgi:hypothetical protein